MQQIPYSQLIVLSLKAFIQRYQNQQLLARTAARRWQHRQIVEGQW